jgi:glycosyltransferase involved in cell wall biosynthesis/ubiquinone/menaquinone biosynthesis C-methylase UbiE
MEIISGVLVCDGCGSGFKVENGMPFLFVNDADWVSKAREAEGWVNYHKALGIYDQTGVTIDFVLPYFEGPWVKVSQMFDTCLDILRLKGSERILDMGAARGWAAKNFALKGCKAVAMDIVPDDQIGLGRSKALMKAACVYYDRIIGDNENFPMGDKAFDVVFCSGVIHHTDKLRDVLKNVYRVLDEDGTFIAINEPCIGVFESEQEFLKGSEEVKYNIKERRPTITQYYEALREAGFTQIRIFPYFLYKKSIDEIVDWTSKYTINKDVDRILDNYHHLNSRYPDDLANRVTAQYGGEVVITARKMKRAKIAMVVQRYGLEVNGGAELLCRQVAEHLSKYYDVEVITTCAIDYMTWKDEYRPGTEVIDGVTVHRFKVDAPRDLKKFNELSDRILNNVHSPGDELEWMKLQGPYSTELLSFIKNNENSYDHFIFFTYLYCTTYFGLPLVKSKSILAPMAHDEPSIYLSMFKELFNAPAAILYNTEEEKRFVNTIFNNAHVMSDIVGVGIESKVQMESRAFREKYGIRDDFIIYVGRIDESKGCKELFDYFLRYKKRCRSNLKLVLVGKPVMEIPRHKDIVSLGFIPEEDKSGAISASRLMIVPSKYESLSMVLLEAWTSGKACLVNGQCKVLKGHCIKSNAGLWYDNYDEFEACLGLMLGDGRLTESLSRNGNTYVERNYSWESIEEKYVNIIDRLRERR